MSATRGRALIINVRDPNSPDKHQIRKGSDHDYKNIENMLKRFGFIASQLSADKFWSAKVCTKSSHIICMLDVPWFFNTT